jgi:hypothetical protein
MDPSYASFLWAVAAFFGVAALAALAALLRPGRHLPQDFDFERHKRFEHR